METTTSENLFSDYYCKTFWLYLIVLTTLFQQIDICMYGYEFGGKCRVS